jgi:hypothetical protein
MYDQKGGRRVFLLILTPVGAMGVVEFGRGHGTGHSLPHRHLETLSVVWVKHAMLPCPALPQQRPFPDMELAHCGQGPGDF